MPQSKRVPRFESEDLERDFWAEQDSSEYVDWSLGKRVVFPQLKPSTKTISLRLPEALLEDLKYLAEELPGRCAAMADLKDVGGIDNTAETITSASAFQKLRVEVRDRILRLLKD